MPDSLPVTLRSPGGPTVVVTTVPQAIATLRKRWPDPTSDVYLHAVNLLRRAKEGSCRASVAFEAFRIAAARQGLLVGENRSPALTMLDALARDSLVLPPDA